MLFIHLIATAMQTLILIYKYNFFGWVNLYGRCFHIIQPSMDLTDFSTKNKNFMNVYLLSVILKCSNLFFGYSVTTG